MMEIETKNNNESTVASRMLERKRSSAKKISIYKKLTESKSKNGRMEIEGGR
jgi:hypothetical protein